MPDYEPIWKDDGIDPNRAVAYTTSGETYTYGEACGLAILIYKRFGRDSGAAAAAWRRMLQNSTTEEDFLQLIQDAKAIGKQEQMRALAAMMTRGMQ